MTKFSKILLDLDGVLVDFDQQFEKIIGVRPENSNRDDHYKNFSRFVHAGGFENAAQMPNARKFFSSLVELSWKKDVDLLFLTSDGSMREFRREVLRQKIVWLQNNGMWLGNSKFILSNGWRGKSDYAKACTILIDDTERNVNHFNESGGNAILYHDTIYDKVLDVLSNAL